MNRNILTAGLMLAAVGLSACENHQDRMVNAKICADFKNNAVQTGAMAAADAVGPMNECLRRWAYSLAGARDGADVVADATVAACGAALSRWNQTALAQQAQASERGPEEALSITTGQPTNAFAEHNAFAQGRALFYVIQARAGRCAPPPAANGAPTGI
jgi:hypothetical protein